MGKKYLSDWQKTIFSFLLTILLLILNMVVTNSVSYALTRYQNLEDAVDISEILQIGTIQAFGFIDITGISSSIISSSTTDTDIIFTGNYAYIIDGITYSGVGSWSSSENSNGNVTVSFSCNLSDGSKTIQVQYDTTELFETTIQGYDKGSQDATVTSSFDGQNFSITKHTEIIDQDNLINTTFTSTVILNDDTYQTSYEKNVIISSANARQITVSIQETKNGISVTDISGGYEAQINSDGSINMLLDEYDLSIDGILTYQSLAGSTFTSNIIDGGIQQNLSFSFKQVADIIQTANFSITDSALINYSSSGLFLKLDSNARSGWSWRDFSLAVGGGLLGGFVSGATHASSIPEPGTAMATIGTETLIGGVAAGMIYSFYYAVNSFQDEEEEAPYHKVYGPFKINQDGSSSYNTSSSSIPTLSEWKRIFLILFLISSSFAFIRHRQHASPSLENSINSMVQYQWGDAIFEDKNYNNLTKWCGSAMILGALLIGIFYQEITLLDIVGILICAPFFAYIMNVIYFEIKALKN